ncbi:hypothetical protein [Domibacillus tundrae]
MTEQKVTVVYSKEIRKGIRMKAIVEGKVLIIVGAKELESA